MSDDIVKRLRDTEGGYTLRGILREAADEIERLRVERDEARRRLCVELLEVEGHPFGWNGSRGAKGIAERLGWNCFNEDPDER
jgi:hypothetical protein